MRGRLAVLALVAASGTSPVAAAEPPAALDRYDLTRAAARHDLPPELREVSGLAVTPAGKLLAHDDERAVVREVDPRGGRVVRSFTFVVRGHPAKGDFEGIAVSGAAVYLTTSDGLLLEGREAADGETVEAGVTDTGLGSLCEIEGLAAGSSPGTLLFACKKARRKELKPYVTLLEWSLPKRALTGQLRIPVEALARPLGEDGFRPSDVTRDGATGHLLLLSSHQRAIAEVTAKGDVVSVRRLPGGHPQAEGLALLPDGTLAVGDEGGRGAGLLTIYGRAR